MLRGLPPAQQSAKSGMQVRHEHRFSDSFVRYVSEREVNPAAVRRNQVDIISAYGSDVCGPASQEDAKPAAAERRVSTTSVRSSLGDVPPVKASIVPAILSTSSAEVRKR